MEKNNASQRRTADIDQYYLNEFASREQGLSNARARMRQMLIDSGLDARQADLGVQMVMAGHPAQNWNNDLPPPPAICVPQEQKAQVERVQNALARLASELEPYLTVSIYPQKEGENTVIRAVPWTGRSLSERALLSSPLSKPLEEANVKRRPGMKSKARRITPAGGLAREELQSELHALAHIRRLAHDLNPLAVFPNEVEEQWVQAGMQGGRLELTIADGQPRAKVFYEKLASDFASLLQKRSGVDAGVLVDWKLPISAAVPPAPIS